MYSLSYGCQFVAAFAVSSASARKPCFLYPTRSIFLQMHANLSFRTCRNGAVSWLGFSSWAFAVAHRAYRMRAVLGFEAITIPLRILRVAVAGRVTIERIATDPLRSHLSRTASASSLRSVQSQAVCARCQDHLRPLHCPRRPAPCPSLGVLRQARPSRPAPSAPGHALASSCPSRRVRLLSLLRTQSPRPPRLPLAPIPHARSRGALIHRITALRPPPPLARTPDLTVV